MRAAGGGGEEGVARQGGWQPHREEVLVTSFPIQDVDPVEEPVRVKSKVVVPDLPGSWW